MFARAAARSPRITVRGGQRGDRAAVPARRDLRAAALDRPTRWRSDPPQRLRPPSERTGSAPTSSAATSGRRVVYGTRVSLIGRHRGRDPVDLDRPRRSGCSPATSASLDAIVMRIMDGMMAIPGVLLAMRSCRSPARAASPSSSRSRSPRSRAWCASCARVVLTVREEPYVEAAIAAGTRLPLNPRSVMCCRTACPR